MNNYKFTFKAISRLRHIFTAILSLVFFAFIFTECDHNYENTKAAQNVKKAIIEYAAIDSSSLVQNISKILDSIPLNTEAQRDKFYKSVNATTFDLHSSGHDREATIILRLVLEQLRASDSRSAADLKEMLNMYIRLGATFSDMGMPGVGQDYYLTGLKFCTDSINNNYRAMFYNNLGILYADGGFYEKAEEFFRKSLKLNIPGTSHPNISLNYSNLAELYFIQEKNEAALEMTRRSLDYVDPKKNPDQLARLRMQQGAIYARLGQHDIAMQRFVSALKQYTALQDPSGIINANLKICENYMERNIPDSALLYANRSLGICKTHDRDDDRAITLKALALILEAKGKYREASILFKEHTELVDSLHDADKRLRLSNSKDFNSDIYSAEIAQKSKTDIIWPISVTLLVLILISLSVYIFFSLRKEKKLIMTSADREAENAKFIDKINRELTTLSLEKLRVQEGVEAVCNDLKQVLLSLNPREVSKRDTIRALLSRLSTFNSSDIDNEFKLFFERVHPDFYRKLNEKYPDLTPRDHRLCAFLYLGLSTKEIASLTYREVRSVESARNRLRKKMGVSQTDDLSSHLQNLR